jgi:hypothetical protein
MPNSRSSGSSSASGSGADVRRAAIEDAGAAAGMRDEAEFRGQHHLVAAAPRYAVIALTT